MSRIFISSLAASFCSLTLLSTSYGSPGVELIGEAVTCKRAAIPGLSNETGYKVTSTLSFEVVLTPFNVKNCSGNMSGKCTFILPPETIEAEANGYSYSQLEMHRGSAKVQNYFDVSAGVALGQFTPAKATTAPIYFSFYNTSPNEDQDWDKNVAQSKLITSVHMVRYSKTENCRTVIN